MFHVVASDLDGTLLTPHHTLSPYTKRVLQALRKQEINFVFATGRHHVDVAQIRQNMAIDAFMITSNGARVHDSEGNLVLAKSIEENIVYDVAQMAKNDPLIYTHIYRGDDWCVNREDESSLQYFQESSFQYKLFDTADFDTNDIGKVYFTTLDDSQHDHLVKLKQKLDAKFGSAISVAFSALNCLDVMASGVSKGSALKFVVEKLGYNLQNSIAFGDSMNDLEMLSMAGKGCLMENASNDLKRHLPTLEMIGSNAQDAVPHYLSKLFLDSKVQP